MDSLKRIIGTLTKEDQVGFRQFLKRNKSHATRKDVELFNLLLEDSVESKETAKLIYPEGNQAAYLALRKRLNSSLSQFIILKLMDGDSSNATGVISMVNMARYLFQHDLNDLGWKYLQKAEKHALKNDLFEILSAIYVLQIQYTPQNIDQKELIEKWKENKVLREKNELGEIALSVVKRKIDRINAAEKEGSFENLIKDTLSELGLANDYLLQPRFVYNLTAANRKKLLREKDFYSLEPFIIQQYKLIEEHGGFKSKHNFYKLGFLYMIAHISYRNRKFESSLDYLKKLESELRGAPKGLKAQYNSKIELLKANLLFFQGDIKGSIDVLKSVSQNEFVGWSQKDRINGNTNLAISYFFDSQAKKAQGLLNKLTHTDKWYEKIMGREWVFKKVLMEIVLFMELEEESLVESRVRYLRRSFRDMFSIPKYSRVQSFLTFINNISNHSLKDTELTQMKLEESFVSVPAEREDLQAMVFYSWLKSKMTKQNPYEVLLDVVRSE